MRYGIFSDVHSNLHALNVVLHDAAARRVDKYVSLGDTVGYAANPRECLEKVLAVCEFVVRGNHDLAVARHKLHDRVDHNFNTLARAGVAYSSKSITKAAAKALLNLPMECVLITGETGQHVKFVHASPAAPADWTYVMYNHQVTAAFRALGDAAQQCFIGHTHQPRRWDKFDGRIVPSTDWNATYVTSAWDSVAETTSKLSGQTLVNVGSVGQPRDNDPRASYVILDTDAGELTHIRVPYDVEGAQAAIRAAKLPEALALRIADGT